MLSSTAKEEAKICDTECSQNGTSSPGGILPWQYGYSQEMSDMPKESLIAIIRRLAVENMILKRDLELERQLSDKLIEKNVHGSRARYIEEMEMIRYMVALTPLRIRGVLNFLFSGAALCPKSPSSALRHNSRRSILSKAQYEMTPKKMLEVFLINYCSP